MYVTSLEIKDFRGFRQAETCFVHPESSTGKKKSKDSSGSNLPNVTLLIGVNGAGKTSILRSVALAVLAPVIQDSGYRPYHLIRKGVKKKVATLASQIILHGQDAGGKFKEQAGIASNPVAEIKAQGSYERLEASREVPSNKKLFDDESPAFFIAGYGATRRVEQVEHLSSQMRHSRGARYQRVAGLFEDYIALFPLGAWFPHLTSTREKRADEVKDLINTLLPADTTWSGEFDDFEPVFSHRGVDLPFGALSDGYRGYIGLFADLLYHLHECCPARQRLVNMSGVVLIDDIDLHLHPRWQREVVRVVATTFPRLQFIFTSHSPLVAGSLHARNIRAIEDYNVGEFQERIHGLNADQVLTSSYFGLTSTRSQEMEKRLDDLADDVAKDADPDAAIAFLRELALDDDTTSADRPFDVFVSYDRRDRDAIKLVAALQDHGLSTWIDQEQILAGDRWDKAIENAIQSSRAAVVFFGQHEMGPWHQQELDLIKSRSQSAEQDGERFPVIPVLLPGYGAPEGLPPFIRARQAVSLKRRMSKRETDKVAAAVASAIG